MLSDCALRANPSYAYAHRQTVGRIRPQAVIRQHCWPRSLPPNTGHVHTIPAPIRRTPSLPDIPVKTGIRPIDDFAHQAMFDRIVMNVIDMIGKVALIAQDVLPIPLLPDRFQIATLAEPRLDQAPARHEIGIAVGQGPDAMQVIGQNDDGVDIEWPLLTHGAECIPQQIHGSCRRKDRPAMRRHHREEKAAAWLGCASVSHGFKVLSDYGLRPEPHRPCQFSGIVGLRPAA